MVQDGCHGTKWPATYMLFTELFNSDVHRQRADKFMNYWFHTVHKTPKGLAWADQWGPLRYAANAAFMALVAADLGIQVDASRNFARTQIHYMLGDAGRSYVVGFGNNPPQRPHHRAASCNWRPAPCDWSDHNKWEPNPQVLYRALVGGPDQWDNYEDRRDDYIKNEVACDYNAGFQGALAGLIR